MISDKHVAKQTYARSQPFDCKRKATRVSRAQGQDRDTVARSTKHNAAKLAFHSDYGLCLHEFLNLTNKRW